jgi:hypothetical protein
MAALFAAGMARHHADGEATVARLMHLGQLRPGAPPEQATAILATLSSPATYASLTGEYAWSFDQCEAWLQDVLRHQLLAPPHTSGPEPG